MWIVKRKIDIDQRLYDLHELRCYSNEMFVKSLRDSKQAMKVLELLQEDLLSYKSKGSISLADITDYT